MTVCFEGFEECVENENMLIDKFFKSFKTNGHHNLQFYDILFYIKKLKERWSLVKMSENQVPTAEFSKFLYG